MFGWLKRSAPQEKRYRVEAGAILIEGLSEKDLIIFNHVWRGSIVPAVVREMTDTEVAEFERSQRAA